MQKIIIIPENPNPEPRIPNPELRVPSLEAKQVKSTYFFHFEHFFPIAPKPDCVLHIAYYYMLRIIP